MNDQYLIVKLDQYAGNVDELVCAALTGWGNDRYGSVQAKKLFNEKVLPLLDPEDEYADLPVEFCEFATEYGNSAYALDTASTNNLKLGLYSCTETKELIEMIDIWYKAYGNSDGQLEIRVDNIHGKTVIVKILGFDLVEVVENRFKLR